MRGEMGLYPCTKREASQQGLESGVAHGSFHVDDPIWRNVWKEKIITLKLSPYLLYKKSLPTWKVNAHIDFRYVVLPVDVIDIAFSHH